MYRTIQKLPLNRLIDYLADNNIYGLVVTGSATEEELLEQWGVIMNDIAAVSQNSEYRLYLSIAKEVAELRLNYDRINYSLGILSNIYMKPLCDRINKVMGTKFVFDWDDQDTYQENLRRCQRRTASMKIKMDMKQLTLDAMDKKHNADGSTPKDIRQYFTEVLITLSDHAKYPVSEFISVFEYYERIKRLNQYYDIVTKNRSKR